MYVSHKKIKLFNFFQVLQVLVRLNRVFLCYNKSSSFEQYILHCFVIVSHTPVFKKKQNNVNDRLTPGIALFTIAGGKDREVKKLL